ncbi:MAG: hypothetical protein ACFFBH_02145 [Promethearchaeota archaeon]
MEKCKCKSQSPKKDIKEELHNPEIQEEDTPHNKITHPKYPSGSYTTPQYNKILDPRIVSPEDILNPKINDISPPPKCWGLDPKGIPKLKIPKGILISPNKPSKNKSELKHPSFNKIQPPQLTNNIKSKNKIINPKDALLYKKFSKNNEIKQPSSTKQHNNDIIKDKQGNILPKYSTLWLVEKLRKEVGKLVPNEKYRDELSYWKLSKYIYDINSKKGYDYIQQAIMPRFNPNSKLYNPIYKFSKEILNRFIKNIQSNFPNEKAKNLVNHINSYVSHHTDLKDKSCQQWHLHKPNLKINYFNKINTLQKAYWLGFLMADGSVMTKKHYYKNGIKTKRKTPKKVIFIELSKKDDVLIKRLCQDIGIDKNRIRYRTRNHYKTGKSHNYAYLNFVNNKIAKDLELQGFSSSKAKRKSLPKFYKQDIPKGVNMNSKKELLMGYIRGYYDGDGFSGTTRICSTSKQFLVRMKHALNVDNSILRTIESKYYKDKSGKIHLQQAQYSLFVGAKYFNKMTNLCKKSNIKVLERKDKHFSESRVAFENLKMKLKNLGINKQELQDLVYQYRNYELVDRFSTSKSTFHKLRSEWNIKMPPNGYWKTNNKVEFLNRKK